MEDILKKYVIKVNDRIVAADKIGGKQAVEKELNNLRNELETAAKNDKWENVIK